LLGKPKAGRIATTGQHWQDFGWKVPVKFNALSQKVRPEDHIDVLRPLAPARYGPLQANGDGEQGIYLTELTTAFAETLAGVIGTEANPSSAVSVGAPMRTNDDLDFWEHRLEAAVETDTSLPPTEHETIIRARCGQGLFKERVMRIEGRCRITKVDNPVHFVVASHCKPWRDSSNQERLNGDNGLLLTPSIDHLVSTGLSALPRLSLRISLPARITAARSSA
jgi:hypothetical protein